MSVFVSISDTTFAQSGPPTEKRVALVVGNSEYPGRDYGLDVLANPVNDAAAVASALRSMNYDVAVVLNAKKTQLDAHVRNFSARLADADVGLFYFSGHGFQTLRTDTHRAVNHIVPIDFRFGSGDVVGTVSLDAILDVLQSQARVGFVFMDACRNDPAITAEASRAPSANRKVRTVGSFTDRVMSAEVNWARPARVFPDNLASGILIGYSAQAGGYAEDDAGGDTLSPYTRSLLKFVGVPGLTAADVMGKVGTDVSRRTSGRQQPWQYASGTAAAYQFVYKPPPAATPPPPARRQHLVLP